MSYSRIGLHGLYLPAPEGVPPGSVAEYRMLARERDHDGKAIWHNRSSLPIPSKVHVWHMA
jgi:SH3-like domain-containing protein